MPISLSVRSAGADDSAGGGRGARSQPGISSPPSKAKRRALQRMHRQAGMAGPNGQHQSQSESPRFETIVADYGNAFIRRHGRIVATRLGANANMELVEIADPDRPDKRGANVRVARRIDPLLALLDRNTPEGNAQFNAAETLRDDTAFAEGRGSLRPNGLNGRSEGRNGVILDARLDAQTRVREAWLAVRGRLNDSEIADVVRLVVLGMATLRTIETARHYRHGTARDHLTVGLQRLAEHYGC